MIRSVQHSDGEVILPEGELGKGFCVLESGTIEVVKGDKVLQTIENAGTVFGELSEILEEKRPVTIRAKGDCVVRHVEENLENIVMKNPKVAIKLIRTLGRRLNLMNEKVFGSMPAEPEVTAGEDSQQIKLLVVDDKPAIIQQLQTALVKNDWSVAGAAGEAEALTQCQNETFNCILISMALPNESAITLRRKLKTTSNVINAPVVGMIVVGDEDAQNRAIEAGFSECISKPFDLIKMEAALYKAMQLDSSERYFKVQDDYLYFSLPSEFTDFIVSDLGENIEARIKNTINEGIMKIIIDTTALVDMDEAAVEVVGDMAEALEKLPMDVAVIAEGEDADMWNNLDGAEDWGICADISEAKEYFARDPEDDEDEDEPAAAEPAAAAPAAPAPAAAAPAAPAAP
ncbi:MAG: response regulator, partial [Opitutales bacterium]